MSDRKQKIDKWVRRPIRELAAYHVPDASGFIKLDAMENPYTWPAEIVESWLTQLRTVSLNRYPDPAANDLKQLLIQTMHVPAGYDVLLGNGSDELIQMILMAVSGADRAVLAPEPGFVMYKMIAGFLNMPYVGVALRDDFSLDRAAMLQAIAQHQPAVIFLAYPNNPTGNLFDDADINAIIAASDGLVVIDEAYHAFAGRTWMQRMPEYDNVVVMRTVSKMGLAGLRLGLLAGHPDWLREFDKVRLPYNINVLTQASAKFALQHQAVLDAQTQQLTRDRELLSNEMRQLKAVEVFPSQANFILFRTAPGKADAVFQTLKQHKVLIKNLSHAGGLLRDCLRVTVGTPDENAAFLGALRSAIHS
ncbi:MAG: histidinol-phosphate transaminase [Gammaproteobacteria bacterium]|nr:histidinol-phosphate transaminase [Gammaproteobacteria bacterium]